MLCGQWQGGDGGGMTDSPLPTTQVPHRDTDMDMERRRGTATQPQTHKRTSAHPHIRTAALRHSLTGQELALRTYPLAMHPALVILLVETERGMAPLKGINYQHLTI